MTKKRASTKKKPQKTNKAVKPTLRQAIKAKAEGKDEKPKRLTLKSLRQESIESGNKLLITIRQLYQEFSSHREESIEQIEDVKKVVEMLGDKIDENKGADDGRYMHVEANTGAIRINQLFIAITFCASLANIALHFLSK